MKETAWNKEWRWLCKKQTNEWVKLPSLAEYREKGQVIRNKSEQIDGAELQWALKVKTKSLNLM